MTSSHQQERQSYSVKRVMVLFSRFQAIWGRKWDQSIEAATLEIAIEEWMAGIDGLPDNSIKAALDYCRSNLEWPPSIAEFIRIAERQSGMPTPRELLQIVIRRDFDAHPLAKLVYERIGSWDLSHGTEKDLLPRIETIMNESRVQPLKGIEDATRTRTHHQLGSDNL